MNINKIKLSGTTYSIQDENATKTVELTQAQYDALAVKDPNTFYIITDATAGDLSNYYTKSETSGATEISTALASKQTTLTAGTGISIVDNVISATGGGGGGKAIVAGRGIAVTTGETADTVSFSLPISAGTGTNSIVISDYAIASNYAVGIGGGRATGDYSFACGDRTGTYFATASGMGSVAFNRSKAIGNYSFACGDSNSASTNSSFACGLGTITRNKFEFSCGQSNISVSASTTFGDSGNTLFSIGNGKMYYGNHNAFEIRQNGDIYIADTNDTSTTNYYRKPMIKLQDALGGGSSYTAGDGIDITNDVISVTGKTDTTTYNTYTAATNSRLSEDEEVTAAGLNALNDAFGGLKLMKISKTDYENLQVKDQNTLYIVI